MRDVIVRLLLQKTLDDLSPAAANISSDDAEWQFLFQALLQVFETA